MNPAFQAMALCLLRMTTALRAGRPRKRWLWVVGGERLPGLRVRADDWFGFVTVTVQKR